MAVMSSYEFLEDEVLHLPKEDRSRLATELLKSLNEKDSGISPEWDEEIQERVAAIKEGRAEFISSEELWKTVNERFGTRF
jgi:putative addiction module component (TIGR02574 family)